MARLTAHQIVLVLTTMNPKTFGENAESQTPIPHDIYASVVKGTSDKSGKTPFTIVQNTNPNPRARGANVQVSPYIRALVRPMNNTVEEARNDGRKVAIHTGTKRSRANNIFRNDQTDLYWLCVDTFKLGKITDENSEGGYSIQGKDSAGNPLALLSAGVNGKCYRLSVPEHFPLTFDKTGKVDTLRAPRYDYETDTWQKDGKSRSTSLMFFADEEDMDNLLGTAVRLFQRRVNGRFTDEAKIDTAGNVKVEGAEGSAEEVVADTEKDNVANRDEPEETENQEPEKETPEEEEVL